MNSTLSRIAIATIRSDHQINLADAAQISRHEHVNFIHARHVGRGTIDSSGKARPPAVTETAAPLRAPVAKIIKRKFPLVGSKGPGLQSVGIENHAFAESVAAFRENAGRGHQRRYVAATLKTIGVSDDNFGSPECCSRGHVEMHFGWRNKKDLRRLTIDRHGRPAERGRKCAVRLALGLFSCESERAAERDRDAVWRNCLDC